MSQGVGVVGLYVRDQDEALDDCRAACERMRARGVELNQEPIDRYGTVDAGFRDPSGNGWKMIQERRPR